MRKYIKDGSGNKKIDVIICNKCGSNLKVSKGIPIEDGLFIDKEWGYFSTKDCELHSFDLCEECYDNFIKSFAIPTEIRVKSEVL